ncbi:MAG: guanine deaminase [Pseudomonadota bacterium]
MSVTAVRAAILHCLHDPGAGNQRDAVEYFDDGILLCENGKIARVGPANTLLASLPDTVSVTEYPGRILMPGFIDCHVHYPQTDIIAAFGTQLLDWLNTYTFPAEARFADRAVADEAARFFIGELLRNGTTTALVFPTVHAHSVDALFEAAAEHNLAMACGKVLMDRNCPENLRDTAQSGYDDSRDLIERWHHNGRARYAITPRFAPTSTPAQLRLAGQLAREFPDTLIHTHIAENTDEIAWVRQLFPQADSYLGVYRDAGLLRERSVFAHGIHLDDHDHQSLADHEAALAFCPTSNLFLGSGLFDLARAKSHGVRVGLGTDVGGGTSFSQLTTLSEAYKVLQLNSQSLSSFRALFLATLGGAQALHMDDTLGNFLPGKAADFVIVDPGSTTLLKRRLQTCNTLEETLFVQMMLADDRAIEATYVQGLPVWQRNETST